MLGEKGLHLFLKPREDLLREGGNLLLLAGTVRLSGHVGKVDIVGVGQQLLNLLEHSEAAHPAVEEADGGCVISPPTGLCDGSCDFRHHQGLAQLVVELVRGLDVQGPLA